MGHSEGESSELYGDDYSVEMLFAGIKQIPVPSGLKK